MNDLSHTFDTAARNFAAYPVAEQLRAHELRKAFHARLQILAEAQRALPAPVAPGAETKWAVPAQPRKFDYRRLCQITATNPVDWIAARIGVDLDIHQLDVLGDSRFSYFQLGRWIAVYIAGLRLDCESQIIAGRFKNLSPWALQTISNRMQERMRKDACFRDMVIRLDRTVCDAFDVWTYITGAVQ